MEKLGNRIVTDLVRNYYKNTRGLAPDKVEQREFGFGTFDERVAFRHVAFKNAGELEKYLVENAPLYADYSAAYYKFPDARPMEKKSWLGSELRFDIDSTDLQTPCKAEHGNGWICERCLDAVKEETLKLIEKFLLDDFGFEENEIEINFSGNRGYHVHVQRQSVMGLNANARNEIGDYIKGNGLDIKNLFPELEERGSLSGPSLKDRGWGHKIARGFVRMIDDEDELIKNGLEKKVARKFKGNKALVEMGLKNGNWDMMRIPKKMEVIPQIVHSIVDKTSVKIDENVTKDPSHLMRLPNSINGSSGLIALKIQTIKALEKFDPMHEAVAFRHGKLKVIAGSKHKLSIEGQEFGPFDNKAAILPTAAAVYLYLKGLANIIDTA